MTAGLYFYGPLPLQIHPEALIGCLQPFIFHRAEVVQQFDRSQTLAANLSRIKSSSGSPNEPISIDFSGIPIGTLDYLLCMRSDQCMSVVVNTPAGRGINGCMREFA